jgi:hypothetical protein
MPEFPDAEVNVTATLTPDSQMSAIENGVFAATAPALGSIEGLTVAIGMVWFAVADVTEQVTGLTAVPPAIDKVLVPLLSVTPESKMPV